MQEISKIVNKRTLSKLDAIVCNQHALVIIMCVSFEQHTPDKNCLVNGFADFLGKNI